ncbi:hypothetical protein FB001_103303 [Ensifer sp. SEMIA 135]|nr:hypothetical protein FB000_10424 [Ensifer sp. SEMIA 134]TWB39515.1 hypothetical protein FB001_103303 [Ensifer sp. SEMIA 135]
MVGGMAGRVMASIFATGVNKVLILYLVFAVRVITK